MPEISKACLNCDSPLSGAHCGSCGQRNAGRKLSLGEAAGQAADNFFSLDAPWIRTAWGLTLHPGRVAAEYAAGKRARYVQPFKYCFATLAVYFLTLRLFDIDVLMDWNVRSTSGGVHSEEFAHRMREFLRLHLETILLLVLPVFAAILGWFFPRSKRDYLDRLALVLFVMGQCYVFGLLITAFTSEAPRVGGGLRAGVRAAWFTWSAVVFFDRRNGWGVARGLLAFGTYMFITIMSAVTAAVVSLLLEG
jgi:hypothetical protein